MKKTLLYLSLLSSFLTFSQILTQDFESGTFPPTGWSVINTEATGYNWMSVLNGFSATGQAEFIINGTDSAAVPWVAENQDESLISPVFSLVGYSDASLNFNAKVGYEYMVSPYNAGDLIVGISTNGGTSWTQLWVEEDYGVFVDYVTLPINLDLSAYAGQSSVQIRFQYIGNDADTVSVDDISVSGTLSSDSFLASKFSVYPNPVNDIISINSDNVAFENISLTDINGRVIKEAKTNSVMNYDFNISDLNSGIYFIKIKTSEGILDKKIIKN